MIPTSLASMGFAPADANVSSPSSSSAFSSQNATVSSSLAAWASNGSNQSFQQVMSSYSETQQDNNSEQSKAQQPNTTQDRGNVDSTNGADVASADTPVDYQQTNSSRDNFASGNNSQDQQAESEAQAGAAQGANAENNAPNAGTAANPQRSAPTQFAGVSTLQMLLKGASLAQVAIPANNVQEMSAQLSSASATATAKAASQAMKFTIAKPLTSSLPPAATTKTAKAKPQNVKPASDGDGTSSVGVGMLTPNGLAIAGTENQAETGGEPASSSTQGPTVGATAADALRLSAAMSAESGANAAATNFAFAVRLTPQTAGDEHNEMKLAGTQNPLTAGTAAQPTVIAAEAALSDAGAGTGQHGAEGNDAVAMMVAGEQTPAAPAQTNSNTPAEDAAPAAPAEPDAATSTDPVRNVRIQLAGDDNQRVDVRLVEVGGEMRVSVKAGDTKLAQTLQDHIPDLSNRLNQQSVRAEIWSPRTESTSQTNGSNVGSQSGRGNDTPGQGGQQQRQGNGRQQQNQPDWVDEFENYSSRTTTIRSNQVWPQ